MPIQTVADLIRALRAFPPDWAVGVAQVKFTDTDIVPGGLPEIVGSTSDVASVHFDMDGEVPRVYVGSF